MIEVERFDLGLEPREMKSLRPEPVGAPPDGRPAKLALDSPLQENRLQPFAAGTSRIIARIGLAGNGGTQPAAEAIDLDIQPGRDGVRRLLIEPGNERTQPLEVSSQALDRRAAWCKGPS